MKLTKKFDILEHQMGKEMGSGLMVLQIFYSDKPSPLPNNAMQTPGSLSDWSRGLTMELRL